MSPNIWEVSYVPGTALLFKLVPFNLYNNSLSYSHFTGEGTDVRNLYKVVKPPQSGAEVKLEPSSDLRLSTTLL